MSGAFSSILRLILATGLTGSEHSSAESLAVGYPGYEPRVAAFRTFLEEQGFGPVYEIRTEVAAPVEHHAEFQIGAFRIPLHSFYPNGVASGPNHVMGEIMYAGMGRPSDLQGGRLEGAIVVMELRSGRAWERWAGLGPKAFVFLQPPPGEAAWADYREKVLETPLEIPRLLLPYEHRGEFFRAMKTASSGSVVRALSWRNVSVPTLLARIPGRESLATRDDPSNAARETAFLVHTHLDGMSLVPGLTPGGDSQHNLDVLKTALRAWKENPPPLTLLVAVFGAEGYALQTSRQFGYRFLTRAGQPDVAAEDRLKAIREEMVRWRDMLTPEVLADPVPWLRTLAATKEGINHPIVIRLSALLAIERNRLSAEILRRLEQTSDTNGSDCEVLMARRDLVNYLSALKYSAFCLQPEKTVYRPWVNALFRASNADEPAPSFWIESAPVVLSSFLVQLRERLSAQIAACDAQLATLRNDRPLRDALKNHRIVFTIGLELSAAGSTLALAGSGDMLDLEVHRPLIRQLGSALRPFTEQFNNNSSSTAASPRLINVLDESRSEHWRRHILYPLVGTIDVFGLLGIPGLTLASAHELRPFFDTPEDRLERVPASERMVRAETAAACLHGLCEEMHRLLSASSSARKTPLLPAREMTDNRNWGCVVGIATRAGAEQVDKTMRGQENVLVVRKGLLGQGWRGADIVRTDERGEFRLPLIPTQHCAMGQKKDVSLYAFRFDEEQGLIIQAANRGVGGATYPAEFVLSEPEKGTILPMFDCVSIGLINCRDPRSFLPLKEPRLYAGRSADTLRLFTQFAALNEREAAVACFVPPGQAVRLVFPGPEFVARMMVLNSSEQEPLGQGVRAGDSVMVLRSEWQTAHDMWWRTEEMRTLLARSGIQSAFVDFLQERVRESLRKAEDALEQANYEAYHRESTRAWSIVSRGYPAVLRLAAGNVHGLVFYMFLILPAAVLLERLCFSFTRIALRSAAVGGIGVVVYQAIAALHPGIRILRNPLVLFISFGLMALTGYVLVLVWSRFEHFMARVRLQSSGVTRENLSRGAAFGLALSVGIGNMRRLPGRTLLTLTALTLFTIVVVSLITVKPSLAVNAVRLSHRPSFDGLLLRSPKHEALSDAAVESISLAAGEGFMVRALRMIERPLSWTAEWTTQGGVSGLPEEAMRRILVAGRPPASGEMSCVLPRLQDAGSGLNTAEWVGTIRKVAGQEVKVVGLFDPDALERLTGPDGEPLTPIDLAELRTLRRIHEARGQEELEIPAPRIPAARSAILSPALAERLGGVSDGILITARSPELLRELGRELVLRTDYYAYLSDGEVGHALSVFDRAKVRGLADIAVPIFICGLIILNTMLGAVASQLRHIPTFSAIGLAPKHIANLFFAEALAYAVIAVLAGFAAGQFAARLLAQTDWISGMVLDYSSAASILGCAVVIGVALLATGLPAWQALTVATPRADHEDRPVFEEGRMHAQLPFALTGRQAPGGIGFLVAFLREHEEMLGAESFYIRDLRFGRVAGQKGYEYRIEFDVWLAPLDLGNCQHVIIHTQTDAHEVMGIGVTAHRLAGDDSSWRAANRGFLSALRKQMLLWRMVADEERERYVRMAEESPVVTGDAGVPLREQNRSMDRESSCA